MPDVAVTVSVKVPDCVPPTTAGVVPPLQAGCRASKANRTHANRIPATCRRRRFLPTPIPSTASPGKASQIPQNRPRPRVEVAVVTGLAVVVTFKIVAVGLLLFNVTELVVGVHVLAVSSPMLQLIEMLVP